MLESCTSTAVTEKKQADSSSVKIETFILKKDTISTVLNLPGELIAEQQVDLYAKISSFVKSMQVDIGSEVKKGALLMTLEAPEMSSQVAAAKSRLQSQQAIYSASKASYNRLYETSKTPGTISSNDLEQAQAKMNSDLAQYQAAQAAYKEVGSIASYLEIRAPFNGVISARNVNLGAYVGPSGKGSESPLFTLQDQQNLRLAVAVPEVYTGYLKQGHAASFTVKSLPSEKFTAQVKRKSGALDLRLRAEMVEMDVPNDSKKLLPGMVAEVHIPLPAVTSTFIVPRNALLDTSEGLFVIKVMDNKSEKIAVKKGRESADKIEVFGELKTGDRLIQEPSEEMPNGMIVK
ncbi:putative Co/Zn/Cd efflux system membrane fusion protein [Arcticibacter svalbardensis MN12-7]|uniref:Putative Co/Zn/Cd efflux system membrane fusion protein n=2 Tax=Arcticibacter TaxID=1288026 RepID=R9GRE5_9SPHI|nr:putative Co/Zn/Cd efflux system membrane fusion protein [Arcticibacter svalbardensis MN12-7]